MEQEIDRKLVAIVMCSSLNYVTELHFFIYMCLNLLNNMLYFCLIKMYLYTTKKLRIYTKFVLIHSKLCIYLLLTGIYDYFPVTSP